MNKFPNKWAAKDIIFLSYIKLNYKKQREIVENYNSLEKFLNAKLNKQGKFFANFSIYSNEIKVQLEICEKNNINIVSLWDDEYPDLLKKIEYPPVLLYVKGKLQTPGAYSIAMVGTRRCSSYGKLCAERFASEFARNNIIVTSGLAYGIDSIAHQSTIKNKGITYAVIASGIDKLQSEASKKIAAEIIDSGGAIISEYRCGTTARPGYFPQRNRIISGICNATLVVESAIKGGSLITARFAQEQGREVFAVPGAISSEKSAGCNWLIHRNMAGLAASPQEMLLDLGFTSMEASGSPAQVEFSNLAEKQVYSVLSLEPQSVDSLLEKTDLTVSDLLVTLLDLEFCGLVRQLPGRLYVRNI